MLSENTNVSRDEGADLIKEIEIRDRENAAAVLKVQLAAYQVEAELIGFYDLPPLKDTIQILQDSEERFFGYYEAKQLSGVIAVEVVENVLHINRLTVAPNHFRKGIGQALLDHIERQFDTIEILKVSTGTKNEPAVQFYQKNGFKITKELLVEGQLSLTYFEKKTKL